MLFAKAVPSPPRQRRLASESQIHETRRELSDYSVDFAYASGAWLPLFIFTREWD
jgi:hypothetical protein